MCTTSSYQKENQKKNSTAQQSKNGQSTSEKTIHTFTICQKIVQALNDYTIKDIDSGNAFKVKQAGIRFTLLAT